MATVVSAHKSEPTSQQEGAYKETLAGVGSRPLEEVKAKRYGETTKGEVNRASFVRTDYAMELEEGVNRQIDFENSLGYISLAISAYMDRDTVALPGCAKFFRASAMSEKEFGDACKFMAFQNTRGGRVQLMAIPMPDSDYYSREKGDALYAFELALALQKLNLDKLKALHRLADQGDDFQAQDFIEDEMSAQACVIKQLGDYVCELQRVSGDRLGVFRFDEELAG
ncbi:hypothetical protein ABPG77_009973 [Micractinium sp. CCAP 211/92]